MTVDDDIVEGVVPMRQAFLIRERAAGFSCRVYPFIRRELHMHKLVLLRHGESIWNKENRFTGWTDVDLSERGMQEAHLAGKLLRRRG